MGECTCHRIESVESFAISADPDVIRSVILVQAEDGRIAQTCIQPYVAVGICVHSALAYPDESLPDTAGPYVAVIVGIKALYRMGREGRRVAGNMGQHSDGSGLMVDDVDTSSVGTGPYGRIPFCHAQDDVVAQV